MTASDSVFDSMDGFSGSTYPTKTLPWSELLHAGDCQVGPWSKCWSLVALKRSISQNTCRKFLNCSLHDSDSLFGGCTALSLVCRIIATLVFHFLFSFPVHFVSLVFMGRHKCSVRAWLSCLLQRLLALQLFTDGKQILIDWSINMTFKTSGETVWPLRQPADTYASF